MKRDLQCALILLVDSLLFPAILAVSKLLHYSLSVHSGILYAVITTAVFFAAGLRLLSGPEEYVGKLSAVILSVTLLCSQIHLFLFSLYAGHAVAVLPVASWVVLSAVIIFKKVRKSGWKGSFLALACAPMLPLFLLLILRLFPLSVTTVLVSEVSPGGTYCAEVLDDDQGALGGATILSVYRYPESFFVGSFAFRKEETTVFSGQWGVFESFQWDDDDHLTMNGHTYSMADYYD